MLKRNSVNVHSTRDSSQCNLALVKTGNRLAVKVILDIFLTVLLKARSCFDTLRAEATFRTPAHTAKM